MSTVRKLKAWLNRGFHDDDVIAWDVWDMTCFSQLIEDGDPLTDLSEDDREAILHRVHAERIPEVGLNWKEITGTVEDFRICRADEEKNNGTVSNL